MPEFLVNIATTRQRIKASTYVMLYCTILNMFDHRRQNGVATLYVQYLAVLRRATILWF